MNSGERLSRTEPSLIRCFNSTTSKEDISDIKENVSAIFICRNRAKHARQSSFLNAAFTDWKGFGFVEMVVKG